MEPFVDKLRQDYASLVFVQGTTAHWSAQEKRITYLPDDSADAQWTLLHELGHALLGHDSYESDMRLLHKEVEAWVKAKALAQKYNVKIDNEYIQQCLDTYREWLHRRSTCPSCKNHGVQQANTLYKCLNCKASWKVSQQRFCRPYRLRTTA